EFSGLKEVGRGGYGIVCKTVCKTAVKRLDSTVAIKRLIVEKNDEKTIQKFVKELSTAIIRLPYIALIHYLPQISNSYESSIFNEHP
ncbi:11139_t:CDS:2, partial [Racocetra fulgida]